ncbi:hypothetical protein GCM10027180_05360 [Microbulbifer echini]
MTQRGPWHRIIYELVNIFLLTVLLLILTHTSGLEGAILAVFCTEWLLAASGWILIFSGKEKEKNV